MTPRAFSRHAWAVKLAIKAAALRMPVPYAAWRRVGLFRHGTMDDPEVAIAVFDRHAARGPLRPGFTVLELGPGDAASTAIVARAHGAARTILVDAEPLADTRVRVYARLADALRRRGQPAPDLRGARTIGAVLARCDATYMTGGLAALRCLPSDSVDWCFSHSVLQHVRLAELDAVLGELRRVQREDGFGSHTIDLRDTISGSINQLRFPVRLWERDWVLRSGYYTNRVRLTELLARFEAAGFDVDVLGVDRWPTLPVPAHRLAAPFDALSDEELRAFNVDVVARRARASVAR